MNTINTTKYKQCRLNLDTHKKLRKLAFDKEISLSKMIDELMLNYGNRLNAKSSK